MSKGAEVKEKLVALRMTADELAALDKATALLAGGALAPSRSQMMRLLIRIGLDRFTRATAPERAELVLGPAIAEDGAAPLPTREEQLREEIMFKRKVEAEVDAAERVEANKRRAEAVNRGMAEDDARNAANHEARRASDPERMARHKARLKNIDEGKLKP